MQRKSSSNNQSEVEYKFHISYGDSKLFSSGQLSADYEYSDRLDGARLSMATADFKGQASIQSNKNTNQSMQATKTPKFLMSPNTNSNHHSTYQSIKGMDDDLFDMPNQHRNTLGSQTSDEIYKVINDFHLQNHKIAPNQSETGTED